MQVAGEGVAEHLVEMRRILEDQKQRLERKIRSLQEVSSNRDRPSPPPPPPPLHPPPPPPTSNGTVAHPLPSTAFTPPGNGGQGTSTPGLPMGGVAGNGNMGYVTPAGMATGCSQGTEGQGQAAPSGVTMPTAPAVSQGTPYAEQAPTAVPVGFTQVASQGDVPATQHLLAAPASSTPTLTTAVETPGLLPAAPAISHAGGAGDGSVRVGGMDTRTRISVEDPQRGQEGSVGAVPAAAATSVPSAAAAAATVLSTPVAPVVDSSTVPLMDQHEAQVQALAVAPTALATTSVYDGQAQSTAAANGARVGVNGVAGSYGVEAAVHEVQDGTSSAALPHVAPAPVAAPHQQQPAQAQLANAPPYAAACATGSSCPAVPVALVDAAASSGSLVDVTHEDASSVAAGNVRNTSVNVECEGLLVVDQAQAQQATGAYNAEVMSGSPGALPVAVGGGDPPLRGLEADGAGRVDVAAPAEGGGPMAIHDPEAQGVVSGTEACFPGGGGEGGCMQGLPVLDLANG